MKRAQPLIELAAAVGDGSTVDWDRVEAAASPAECEVVRHLRLVEQIAAVHGRLPPLAVFERSLHDSLLHPAATDDVSGLETPVRWGALVIVRKVGSGTYADVYEARDSRLDRPVALKLLRHRDAGAAAESEAIEEARLLARVRHPNVVTVYGAERIDGRVGIWMELVDGQTLEQELKDRGRLPAVEIVEIGLALCGALDAVHAAGLLHRDVKAQNVMRSRDGRVLLTDFGTGREAQDRTLGRELAGTPLYLAAEVLAGEPASVASDVYSLGVLLHHLATGSFPVRGRSLRDLHDAHTRGVTESVGTLRPDLPKPLASTIDHATALRQGGRCQSPAALRTALTAVSGKRAPHLTISRRLAIAATALVMVTLWAWLKWPRPPAVSAAPQWVLVSAFENHTGDPRLDDVLRFVLEQELSQSQRLTVVPRERIMDTLRLMRRAPDAPLDAVAAREVCLRDGAIPMFAAGRIDRLGTAYSLIVTLEDARTVRTITRAGFEVPDLDAVPRAVRTLAGRVRAAMGDQESRVEADGRLEPVTTASLDALRAYTRGMALMFDGRSSAAEAPLKEAIRHDPNFASAAILLAHSLRDQGRAAQEYVPFAEKALQLSANLPSRERHFIAGSYYGMIAGPYYGKVGDNQREIAEFEALVREYPHDFWGLNSLLHAYYAGDRYRDSIPISKRLVLERPNDFIWLVSSTVQLLIASGDLAAVRPFVARAASLDPPTGPAGQNYAAWVELFPVFDLWADGRVVEAAARLDALASHAGIDEWHAFGLGQMNLSLGRVRAAEAAFAALPSDDERQAMLGYAALARGDITGARAALLRAPGLLVGPTPSMKNGRWGPAFAFYWSLVQAGLAGEAELFAHRGVFEKDMSRWIDGGLSLAHGDVEAAIPVFERVRRVVAPGSPQTFIAAENLAEIYERRGDHDAAEGVLLDSDQIIRAAAYPNAGSLGYMWLRLRVQLLALERGLGHRDRADRIARELRQTLQVADSDFGLLRGLN